MKALRKLVLGETWALPIGVFLTVGVALVLHETSGSAAWWRHAGGFVLLVLVVATLAAALAPAYRARR